MKFRLNTFLTLLVAMVGLSIQAYGEVLPSERANREKRFVMDLLKTSGSMEDDMGVEDELLDSLLLGDLKPYADDVFVLPGDQLQYKFVNTDRYFGYDTITHQVTTSKGIVRNKIIKKLKFLYDPRYPKESLQNLMVIPLDEGADVPVKLTILTHEYRSKATLDTTVDKLISFCQYAGCTSFMGFERPRPTGETAFTVFMLNEEESYIHVFRFECDAVAVINGKAPIYAKASLYIPTDNIDNLFEEEPEGKSQIMLYHENQPIQ